MLCLTMSTQSLKTKKLERVEDEVLSSSKGMLFDLWDAKRLLQDSLLRGAKFAATCGSCTSLKVPKDRD